jgi:hypothetical protein
MHGGLRRLRVGQDHRLTMFATLIRLSCASSCDNCKGSFKDISTRMDEFKERIFINGWERTKAVWTVPQGFGNDTYIALLFSYRLSLTCIFL